MLNALLLLANYFLGYQLIYPLLAMAVNNSEVFVFTFPAVLALAVTIVLCRRKLLHDWRRTDFKQLFSAALKFAGLLMLSSIITGLFVVLFGGVDTNSNQRLIEQFMTTGAYRNSMVFYILVFAPLVEESVFRGAVYQLLGPKARSNRTFLIVSGLIFALMHVIVGLLEGNVGETWLLLSYGALGGLLAWFYRRHQLNILYPILAHFFYNGVQLWIMNLYL